MKRVGIIGLLHESNTLIRQPTTIEHFRQNVLARGEDGLNVFRGSQHELGGFIDVIESEKDFEAVGIFVARATPYGTIESACWNELMRQLSESLKASLPLDGLLVAPHGATVAENAPDADGFWLGMVRSIVGPEMPIVGTLDLHANVSQAMVDACQALFGYRTNPHLDQRERGMMAGKTIVRTVRGEISPQQYLVQLPFCVNIERQATAEPQGRSLWNRADELAKTHPDVLSVSCLYGFPYADVKEMGASVIAVAAKDRDQAKEAAKAMADHWWQHRDQFVGRLVSIEDAIKMACQTLTKEPGKPVGLLEMGDNVGGGSPGDGTAIVHGWLQKKAGRILTVIADPEAVQAAIKSGVGTTIDLAIGGKLDPELHGPPICDRFQVRLLSDGRFREPGTTHGGYSDFDQGLTAVLAGSQGSTIIATTHRVAPLSIQQILSQGVRPDDFAAIVIKGVHAPVAAYANFCSQLIRVNTSGATTADLNELALKNRRVPMYPFES